MRSVSPPVSNSEVKLVCFDLGGVLVRLCKSLGDACIRAGLDVGRDFERQWHTHASLHQRYETGELSEGEYERELPRLFPEVSLEQIRSAFDAYLLGLYPGVPQLLDDLKSRGIRTAILSNTNPRHFRAVTDGAEYAALKSIDHFFASCQLGFCKPDPRIYRHVEQTLGVAGDSIIYFDDLAANVDGAAAVRWRAHRIDPNADPVAQIRRVLKKAGLLSA